jgi:hypothetical protein
MMTARFTKGRMVTIEYIRYEMPGGEGAAPETNQSLVNEALRAGISRGGSK